MSARVMSKYRPLRSAAIAGSAWICVFAGTAGAVCVGDCDGNGQVSIAEAQACVNLAHGLPAPPCAAADQNHDGTVEPNEVDACIQAFLDAAACPMVFTPAPTSTGTSTPQASNTPLATPTTVPTNTATPLPTSTATAEPSATATAVPPTPTTAPTCPLTAGRYTITTTGGALRVATFLPFPFPPGGKTIQDVGPGDANCVHETVIPFPGGLTVPVFCVPALGATTSVTQSGCGVGRIDSNGGSDFTVDEEGDTSDAAVCNDAQAICPGVGPAPDSAGRIDITVGNGTADICPGGGTVNAIVSIPVDTLTWVAADASCPDTDGTFNPGADTQLAHFPQTLDLTTDTAAARFIDLDGDHCARSGLGPALYANENSMCAGAGDPMACCTGNGTGTCAAVSGKCIDLNAKTVNIAGSGTIFTSGGPTYDLLFATVQKNTVSGPDPSGDASCGSPPVINFDGKTTRCLSGP
jgi:hypothetical protein